MNDEHKLADARVNDFEHFHDLDHFKEIALVRFVPL